MLSFEEACERLEAWAKPIEPSRVRLADAAERVLAEDVVAAGPLPPFDYSAMDGYAVVAASVQAGRPMPVAGESRAGAPPPPLTEGAAMRIFTGAPIPAGADAVIMQERATREAGDVTFEAAPRAGENIRRAGEDVAAGAVVLRKGRLLGPAEMSLLASVDRGAVLAHPAPHVVVVPTGDELREPGSPPRAGSIPESNGLAIRGMAARAGAEARVARATRDDVRAVTGVIERALDSADVLVTIGGVSVGDHDVVREALERAGCTLDAWKVAIRPGKPIVIGRRGAALVLGLPGNPASAMVTFGLFGVPILRAMRGLGRWKIVRLQARLEAAVKSPPGRRPFLRATLSEDRQSVQCARNQSSGAASVMAESNALVTLPAEADGARAGDRVEVIPFAEIGL
jgi:molybdopterin molybdotransferase